MATERQLKNHVVNFVVVELIKKHRDEFKFILFLFLVALSSGIILAATGLSTFVAAVVVGLGILIIPLFVVIPYIIYRENKHIKEQKLLQQEQTQKEKQEQERLQQEKTDKEKQVYEQTLKASPAGKAEEKIILILKKAPQGFPFDEGLVKRGDLAHLGPEDNMQALRFTRYYEYIENHPYPIVARTPKEAIKEINFFIALMKAIFDIDLNYKESPKGFEELFSRHYGHYFCQIDSRNLTKIIDADPSEIAQKATQFYGQWEKHRKIKSDFEWLLDNWLKELELVHAENQNKAILIKNKILDNLIISEIKTGTLQISYEGEISDVDSDDGKDLLNNLKKYLKNREDIQSFNLEHSLQTQGQDRKILQLKLTIQKKENFIHPIHTAQTIGSILDMAPPGFPLNAGDPYRVEGVSCTGENVVQFKTPYKDDSGYEEAHRKAHLFMRFMQEVFNISIKNEPVDIEKYQEVACYIDSEDLEKINQCNREEIRKNAKEFYKKWQEENQKLQSEPDANSNDNVKVEEIFDHNKSFQPSPLSQPKSSQTSLSTPTLTATANSITSALPGSTSTPQNQ